LIGFIRFTPTKATAINILYHRVFLAVLCVVAGTHVAFSELVVDRMFGDHMVLQQGLAVPIWGTATADAQVTVAFAGQTKSVIAGEDGSWSVKLDPLKAGDASRQLTVTSGESKTTLEDVLVGEVWLGSGQSNMAGGAGGYARNDLVLQGIIDGGPYPKLRLYTRDGWQIATPDTMKGFSAIHLSFGKALHDQLNRPMGLMVGAVGGTPSGRWLSKEMISADKQMMRQIKAAAGADSLEELTKANDEAQAAWQIEADKAKEAGKKPPRFRKPFQMADLYQRHIEPKVPYGIRGVLWDQGESRTGLSGVDQVTTMRALINGWRKVWGQGDFHFLHVQKPSGGGCAWDYDNPVNKGAVAFTSQLSPIHQSRPETLAYQLSHIEIGTIKNAPLVTAVDLQPGIHPANKSGYGKRASRVAIGTVYGKDVVTCGPTYRSHKVEGSKIRLAFNHVGSGLAARHADSVHGFAISGTDKKWVWADAVIDGDTLLVSSPDILQPVNVQYAFDKNSAFANLFNKDGLPALMFTTVEWK
jgi:sialate O-acetylesterase